MLAFPMDLSGKTILVTGASGALGSELTNVLSSKGAKVLGTATNNESAGSIPAKAEVRLLLDYQEPDSIQTLTDYLVAASQVDGIINASGVVAFGSVSFAHLCSGFLAPFFSDYVATINSETSKNIFTFLGSSFFWMISIATIIAIALSFTKAKNYEGAGASKFGSVFIYILVASIGMKMDLTLIFDNTGLIAIGVVWMTIHALLLIGVAKLTRAPYFFLAVGSQANVGGAASAPIVASAFHPSLASVGVLLAVFGYAVGTIAAIACTILMELASATS